LLTKETKKKKKKKTMAQHQSFAYPYLPYTNNPQLYPWQFHQQTTKSKKQSHFYPYQNYPYNTQYYYYPNLSQQQLQQQQFAYPAATEIAQLQSPNTIATTSPSKEKKRVGLVRSDTTEFEISEILSKVGLVRLPIPPDGSCMV